MIPFSLKSLQKQPQGNLLNLNHNLEDLELRIYHSLRYRFRSRILRMLELDCLLIEHSGRNFYILLLRACMISIHLIFLHYLFTDLSLQMLTLFGRIFILIEACRKLMIFECFDNYMEGNSTFLVNLKIFLEEFLLFNQLKSRTI